MMDIIKKNAVSIACGIVAIFAMIAVLVWPLPGWFDSLQAKLDASKSDHATIKSLMSQPFMKPILDPSTTEAEKLGQFPNEAAIKAGIAIVAKLKEQTAAMEKMAIEINQHRPLVPGALPLKRGNAYGEFKLRYYERLEYLKKFMNAVTAPTQEEVAAEAERLKVEDYEKRYVKVAGAITNQQEVDAVYAAHVARLPEEMRKARAKQATVFLNDSKTMNCCQGIIPPPESAEYPADANAVWAAQLTLWLQEDIVQAIADTNQLVPNATVETAIVKRLVTWEFPKSYITKKGEVALVEGQAGQPGGGRNMMPMQTWRRPTALQPSPTEAVTEEEANPAARDFTASPTGRVCNTLYDVVHFTLVVDTDAQRVREFMAKLTDNRFITILSTDIVGVDRDREQWRGFVYGPNPVVRVRLNCEAIFLRSWTLKLMPPTVQKLLLIPQPGESTASAGF